MSTLKVAAATGLVTGTFVNPDNGNKVNTFNAVILTKPTTTTGAGYGYFLTVPAAAIGAPPLIHGRPCRPSV